MPYTVRVKASLARCLLESPDEDLRRRLDVLRATPLPPGSRSVSADAEWHRLDERFPELRAFIYGSTPRALIYTYDSRTDTAVIEFAIIDGVITP